MATASFPANQAPEAIGPANPAPPPGPPGNATLRFEDLTIDDELNLLERVVRYCRSGIALQRLVHVKMLKETVDSFGTEVTIRHLLPLLPSLVTDPEPIIRQHVAMQLLPLSLHYLSSDQRPTVIETFFIHLSKLLSDSDSDVRKASSETLASLSRSLSREDAGIHLLPMALRLAHSRTPDDEELRTTACALLGELSHAIGSAAVTRFVTPTVLSLSEEGGFRLRKAAVMAIPQAVSSGEGEDVEGRLLGAYLKLSEDDFYRVRKATAECVVDMSRGVVNSSPRGREMRRKELIPMVRRLLSDDNKMVRQGMMQFMGPFIASFFPLGAVLEGERDWVTCYFPHAARVMFNCDDFSCELYNRIPSDQLDMLEKAMEHRKLHPPDPLDLEAIKTELLPHFLIMSANPTGDAAIDAEMRVHCAYSLPAVLLLLGPEEWQESNLRGCFYTLVTGDPSHVFLEECASIQPIPAVKRCLASSLHALAQILGTQIVEANPFLSIIEHAFFRSVDEITKTNSLKHFASFFRVFSPPIRKQIVPILSEILNAAWNSNSQLLNWRLRNVLAKQLDDLMDLLDDEDVEGFWIPLVQHFMLDPVAQVRENTYPHTSKFFSHAKDSPRIARLSDDFFHWIELEMANNQTDFSRRQGYCRILEEMAPLSTDSKPFFTLKMLPLALPLRGDKVINVRCSLRKCLEKFSPADLGDRAGAVLDELTEEIRMWDPDSAADADMVCEEKRRETPKPQSSFEVIPSSKGEDDVKEEIHNTEVKVEHDAGFNLKEETKNEIKSEELIVPEETEDESRSMASI